MKRTITITPQNSQVAKKPKNARKTRRRTDYQVRKGFETIVPKFPKSVFPYSKWATLKYSEAYITVNPAIGAASAYVLAANDLYDPNVTGTGHQPTGFDQYMAMYNKFVVYASKIKAVAYSPDAEANDTVGGVAVYDSNSIQIVTENYMEQALTDWKVIPGGAGAQPISVNTAFNARDFSGTDPKDNDLLHGTGGASPSKKWFYHLFVGATGSSEDPGSIKWTIEVEYLVKFFEPKSQTIS